MKSITTLVSDIYALLEKGQAKIDAGKLGEMIAARLSPSTGGDALRMSSLGEKCLRKLWYKSHQPEKAEPIPGHTLLKFLKGDIAEELALSLAEQAGHTVERRQEEVTLHGVIGHIDAIVDGVLLDVKSANSRSIDKFKTHSLERDDPFGYMDQLSAYAAATNSSRHAFLAFDKELGHLVLDEYPIKPRDWQAHIQRIQDILRSETPPPRGYHPVAHGSSGNLQLPLECRYCQYKFHCWPTVRTFLYSNSHVHLTHVVREPNVQELLSNKTNENSRRPSMAQEDETIS